MKPLLTFNAGALCTHHSKIIAKLRLGMAWEMATIIPGMAVPLLQDVYGILFLLVFSMYL